VPGKPDRENADRAKRIPEEIVNQSRLDEVLIRQDVPENLLFSRFDSFFDRTPMGRARGLKRRSIPSAHPLYHFVCLGTSLRKFSFSCSPISVSFGNLNCPPAAHVT